MAMVSEQQLQTSQQDLMDKLSMLSTVAALRVASAPVSARGVSRISRVSLSSLPATASAAVVGAPVAAPRTPFLLGSGASSSFTERRQSLMSTSSDTCSVATSATGDSGLPLCPSPRVSPRAGALSGVSAKRKRSFEEMGVTFPVSDTSLGSKRSKSVSELFADQRIGSQQQQPQQASPQFLAGDFVSMFVKQQLLQRQLLQRQQLQQQAQRAQQAQQALQAHQAQQAQQHLNMNMHLAAMPPRRASSLSSSVCLEMLRARMSSLDTAATAQRRTSSLSAPDLVKSELFTPTPPLSPASSMAPMSPTGAPASAPKAPVRRSKYRGVIWDRNSRAWRAKLSVKGKLVHVGLFEDEQEAAIAWDRKAIEIRGANTRLNFPGIVGDIHLIELKSQRARKKSI